jgi:signal transduction histidine kinase
VTGLLEVAVLVDGRLVGAVHAATSGPRVLGDQDEAAVTTLAAFAEVMLGHLERLRIQRAAADQEAAAATARERERMRTHMLARVIDAQEAERARVARDLHDQIGQALTSVLLGLHLVDAAVTEDRVVPQEAARQTAEVRELVADALRDVRRLAFELRPTLLDDVGLVAALDRLAADLRTRYPVTVEMSVEGLTDDVRLPPEVETVAYRVVQESLTNVVRHSGAAAVSVGIEHLEGTLRAVVADDGVGFDPLVVRTSLGLRGMEERAGLVGGTLVLDSAPGRGATVVLEIPLG